MLRKIKSKINSDSNLKELVSGSLLTFILRISGMIISYLLVYLISIRNGSEGVGHYSLISNFLLLLGVIAAMGTNVSVLRYVGQFNNDKDNSKLRSLYFSVIKLSLPVAIIGGTALVLFAESISIFLFKNKDFTEAVVLTGFTLPFFTLNLIAVEFLRGLKKLKASEFIRSVARPLIIIICILLYSSESIENIEIIYFLCGATLLNFVASSFLVLFNLSKIKKTEKALSINELFKVSSPMMITEISGILMASISIFMLEYFATTEEVGIYSVAFRLSALITIILLVVNTISAPKFSELFWGKKMVELQKVIRQSVKMIFWGSLIIAVIISAGSIPILNIFGKEFTDGQLPLIILIFGQLFNAATGSVGLILNMSGNQTTLRNTAVISLTTQLILAIILIPTMGMVGAAISLTAGRILRNLMCILYVKRKLNLKTYYLPSFKK